MNKYIGITERGDAALDLSWSYWVIQGKPAILITKDPLKLFYHLEQLNKPNVIVHCVITGLSDTPLEPYVPPTVDSINGYYRLINLLGNKRIILRIDPIIPSLHLSTSNAIEIIKQAVTRVRISFFDNYPHVKERFKKVGLPPLDYPFHAPLEYRKSIYEKLLQYHSPIEVCGEPDFPSTGCISEIDCEILGVKPFGCSNQRKHCNCLGNKKELLKNKGRCFHNCLYCYWKD